MDGFEYDAAIGVFDWNEAVIGATRGDGFVGVFGGNGVDDLAVDGCIMKKLAGGFFGE